MDKELIKRLKTARKMVKMTQHQLAKEISGISGRAIQNYEQGVSEPPISFVNRLAKIANMSPAWLAFGDISTEVGSAAFDELLMRQAFSEIAKALDGKGIPPQLIFESTLELYRNKLKAKAEVEAKALIDSDADEIAFTGTYGK